MDEDDDNDGGWMAMCSVLLVLLLPAIKRINKIKREQQLS
jgi:hypothetical protein